jgi:hypothetical protein
MVDGFHILIYNRTKKPLVIVLSGAGRRVEGQRDGGGVLTNVQCKPFWNYHNEPLQIQQIFPNKKINGAWHQWLTPVILASQEAEI